MLECRLDCVMNLSRGFRHERRCMMSTILLDMTDKYKSQAEDHLGNLLPHYYVDICSRVVGRLSETSTNTRCSLSIPSFQQRACPFKVIFSAAVRMQLARSEGTMLGEQSTLTYQSYWVSTVPP